MARRSTHLCGPKHQPCGAMANYCTRFGALLTRWLRSPYVYLLQARRADAAVLELGQHYQLAHVDEVRTVLNADISNWRVIALDNLMRGGVPAASKVRILCSQIPRSELLFNHDPTGLMVHLAAKVGISRCCQSALQSHTARMPHRPRQNTGNCLAIPQLDGVAPR